MAVVRQFEALIGEGEWVPDLADYDDLFDVANMAVHWLEDHPCPDGAAGRSLAAQMMGYRAIADTVRSTLTEVDGDVMVAQLWHLRAVIDRHAEAVAATAVSRPQPPLEIHKPAALDVPMRRHALRQTASWEGSYLVEGDPETNWRECRIIDISMLGLGLILDHATPDALVGRAISVEVAVIDNSVNFRLAGTITHAAPTLRGAVRIGVEFDALFEPAQDVRPVQSAADEPAEALEVEDLSPTLQALMNWLDTRSGRQVPEPAEVVS